MSSTTILDALRRETIRTGDWLAAREEKDWARPTRCAPLTVLELTAHAWRGSQRILEMLDGGVVTDREAEKDAITYWDYEPGEGVVIVQRAKEVAASFTSGQELVAAWKSEWTRALARCERLDPTLLYRCPFGVIRLEDYLSTRIIEVSIHTMDLRDALGEDPDPDPGALVACADVLRSRLGTDARLLGIEDVRFTLIGTGRAPLSEREREVFGPLADKFPLLA